MKNRLKYISGFSSWDKIKKLELVAELTGIDIAVLREYSWGNSEISQVIDQLSENTIAHFPFPFGLAPNFKINGKDYILPLVIEESSVVAALAKAAKNWYTRGGFHAEVINTLKKGQIHFIWNSDINLLRNCFSTIRETLFADVKDISKKMEKRGGGILDIQIIDKSKDLPNYYQLDVSFDTRDAMGANFINSVLEKMAESFRLLVNEIFPEIKMEVIMSILSNYTPDCLVKVWAECPIENLNGIVNEMTGVEFASRFEKAIQISKVDLSRAVTHNKGIFNGIDALAIATGNDWRSIESAGHAYAARNGNYQGLTNVSVVEKNFYFSLEIPMNIGTVGGVTGIHPLAKLSMKILGNPSAKELMILMATAGLASNFSAISALIGKGIQKGHMKMHLNNILLQLNASDEQIKTAYDYFKDKTVSHSIVEEFLNSRP